jgi:hypothetical protein
MDINELELVQIEVNVLIILTNDECGKGKIIPFWECDYDYDKLKKIAIYETLSFAEQCGFGSVSYEIKIFNDREVKEILT